MKCPPRCSGHLQRKYYFRFCKSGRAAAPPDLLFHGKGRYGKWHRLLLACGQSAEGELAFCGKESRNVPPGAMSFRYQMPLPAMTPLVKRQLRKIRRFSGVAIKNNISSNYGAAHAEPFQIVLFRFPASVQGAGAPASTKKHPPCGCTAGALKGSAGVLSGWCPCPQPGRRRSSQRPPRPSPGRGRSGAGPCWGCPGAC